MAEPFQLQFASLPGRGRPAPSFRSLAERPDMASAMEWIQFPPENVSRTLAVGDILVARQGANVQAMTRCAQTWARPSRPAAMVLVSPTGISYAGRPQNGQAVGLPPICESTRSVRLSVLPDDWTSFWLRPWSVSGEWVGKRSRIYFRLMRACEWMPLERSLGALQSIVKLILAQDPFPVPPRAMEVGLGLLDAYADGQEVSDARVSAVLAEVAELAQGTNALVWHMLQTVWIPLQVIQHRGATPLEGHEIYRGLIDVLHSRRVRQLRELAMHTAIHCEPLLSRHISLPQLAFAALCAEARRVEQDARP